MLTWGLCKDEFQDNGGWPHQLYVREARRMVSDYVMTQANCQSVRTAPKSIGLASYTMDSHNCRRIVNANGHVRNEGDVQIGVPQPYEIGYDAIVPAESECDNLLVTFCLSASHVAFGSCRMEPVFMITSQSAATAAAFAIDDDVPVQDVNYEKLSNQLIADDQVLEWGGLNNPSGGLVIDNRDPACELVGVWTNSSATVGFYGTDYFHDRNEGQGTKYARFSPDLPAAQNYHVYLNWPSNPNRASNVPVTIGYDGGSFFTNVNQRAAGSWAFLGTFPFAAGTNGSLLVETTDADGFVIADAVSWVAESAVALTRIGVLASDPVATEGDLDDPAKIVFTREDLSPSATGSVVVAFSVMGSANTNELSGWPDTVIIPPDQTSVEYTLTAVANNAVEIDRDLVITLHPQPGVYALTALNQATVTVREIPYEAWRREAFSVEQLLDPLVSGIDADPDEDRLQNLWEFLWDSSPLSTNASAAVLDINRVDDRGAISFFRSEKARRLPVQLEVSQGLSRWERFSGDAVISRHSPFETLVYEVDPAGIRYWRMAANPNGFAQGATYLFYSFDAAPDGQGAASIEPTIISSHFPGTPAWRQLATLTGNTGGALFYEDIEGTQWLGSGNSAVPGHGLAWQPGSIGNGFELSFSTVSLRDIRIRFDYRSAQQPGGTAPTEFTSITYDVGGGAVPLPGAQFALIADNTFREWQVDLTGVVALENQPLVTFRWHFEDLVTTPAESFRLDNLFVEAVQ